MPHSRTLPEELTGLHCVLPHRRESEKSRGDCEPGFYFPVLSAWQALQFCVLEVVVARQDKSAFYSSRCHVLLQQRRRELYLQPVCKLHDRLFGSAAIVIQKLFRGYVQMELKTFHDRSAPKHSLINKLVHISESYSKYPEAVAEYEIGIPFYVMSVISINWKAPRYCETRPGLLTSLPIPHKFSLSGRRWKAGNGRSSGDLEHHG